MYMTEIRTCAGDLTGAGMVGRRAGETSSMAVETESSALYIWGRDWRERGGHEHIVHALARTVHTCAYDIHSAHTV